jgi:hypothetical protein
MDIIEEFGISKTVYSLCFPETKKVLESLWNKSEGLHDMYSETWTKKQDNYHLSFAETFKEWSKPNLTVNWDDFPFFYPTNGASEAIREQLAYLSTKENKRIFVFDGEYEGYEAVATALNMVVVKINREKYTEYAKEFEQGGSFFISQPSSIEGNVWNEFNAFMSYLSIYDNVSVYIDTVYVGCISKEYSIYLDFEIIKGVFFSLSKAFGVYYHRIGGVFLKEANPLLYGNMWFKNVFSMRYGEELMKQFNVYYFPKKYNEQKLKAIKKLESVMNLKIRNSDALLLTTIVKDTFEHEKLLSRSKNSKEIRVCITPTLEKIINKVVNNE